MSVLLLFAHVHFRKNLSNPIQYGMVIFSFKDNMNVMQWIVRNQNHIMPLKKGTAQFTAVPYGRYVRRDGQLACAILPSEFSKLMKDGRFSDEAYIEWAAKKGKISIDGNHRRVNVKFRLEHGEKQMARTLLDNPTADTATSETENDMAKRLRHRATVGDKSLWITGETQQDLFNAYLQHAIDAGIVVPAGEAPQPKAPAKDVLFETRAWQWYNLYKVGKVRLTTLANYELYLKKHLVPYFGQCDIRTITIDNVQEFMNSKADYSKKMIDELWLTLSMVLNAAVEDGLISLNPAKSKRLRNPSTKKTIREALTSAEADDIEAHLQDIPQLRDRRYVAMLLKFPARCEDIRGLQIKDFNFEEKTVTITKGVTYAKGHTVIGDPKTPAGKRKMLILPGLLEALELSQEELNDPETYILATLGDPHTPLSFQADRRLWERVKKAINVFGKTPHCFRHTFATRAHRAGVDDKTLQSMGGWKDLSTMKNVYIHTQDEDLEIARQQLAAV